jgi:hypothetical protein
VIVWLWDASGFARTGHGVTDDEARARQAAETLMRRGHATVARLEKAHAMLGIQSLTSGYQRVGEGWTARRQQGGQITWTPFTTSLSAAACLAGEREAP